MTLIVLDPQTRALLEALAAHTHQAKELRRALALLWLDRGESLATVAQRLYVTRQTVSNWGKTFHERRSLPLPERLADGLRSGRPRRIQALIEPRLRVVLAQDPRALGSPSTVWTAPLLTHYLRDAYALRVSRQSVSLALAHLDVRWKRPRYRLAHRSATWRQAKGGSSGGCTGARARSSSCSMRPSSPRCLPSPTAMGPGASQWRCLSPGPMPGASCTGCCIAGAGMSCGRSRRPGTRRRSTPASR